MQQVIYLCGPMTGLTPEQASAWREEATAKLTPQGFICASPMRVEGKLLKPGQTMAGLEDTDEPALQGPAIYWRDMYDLEQTNILFCNLNDVPLGPCIGSVYEIGFCDALRPRPARIVVARKDSPFRRHPMITTKADAVFEELDPAYDFIIANFGLFNVPPVTVISPSEPASHAY